MFTGNPQPVDRWEKNRTYKSRRESVRTKIDTMLQESYRDFMKTVGHEPEDGQEMHIVEPVLWKLWSFGVNIAEEEGYARYEQLRKGMKNSFRNAVENGGIPEIEVCCGRYRLYKNEEIREELGKETECFGVLTPDEEILLVPADTNTEEELWVVLRYCGSGEKPRSSLYKKLDRICDNIRFYLVPQEQAEYLFVEERELQYCIDLLRKAGCCVLEPPEETGDYPDED